MSIHGKYNVVNRLHPLTTWAVVIAGLLICLVTGSCRSSRNLVQETTSTEHCEADTTEQALSFHAGESDSLYQREAVRGGSGDSGRIDIERDSAGRPVTIIWYHDFRFEGFGENLQNTQALFTFSGHSGTSKTSGTVDSVTEKKEETSEEINASISLENIIGSSLVILVIVYLIYIFISDQFIPWLKKKRQ